MKHETKSNGILEMLKEPPTHFVSSSEARKCQLCFADCLQAFYSAEVLSRPKSSGYTICPHANAALKSPAFQRLGAHEICSLEGLASPSRCWVEKNVSCGLTYLDGKACPDGGPWLQNSSAWLSLLFHQARGVLSKSVELQRHKTCAMAFRGQKGVRLPKKTIQGIANMSKT